MTNERNPKKESKVNATVWIMLVLSGTLTLIAYLKGSHLPLQGLKNGGNLLLSILPTLLLAFSAAGMISIVLPGELLTKWLGEESGFRGLFIATCAGSVTPGGPFVQFPIVATLLESGAGVAPLMAYISAWSLLGVNRFLVYEVPLLGWKLSVSRMLASLIFPIIIGWMTRVLWLRL